MLRGGGPTGGGGGGGRTRGGGGGGSGEGTSHGTGGLGGNHSCHLCSVRDANPRNHLPAWERRVVRATCAKTAATTTANNTNHTTPAKGRRRSEPKPGASAAVGHAGR